MHFYNTLFVWIILLLVGNKQAIGQKTATISEKHNKTINDFIAGYNSQNFNQMSNTLGGLMKVVFTKKQLKKIYSYQYNNLGQAKIAAINSKTSGAYLLHLLYERDSTEIEKLGLSISKKGKIIGLSSPSVRFNFAKTVADSNKISDEKLLNQIDSIANRKYQFGNFNGNLLVLKNKQIFYQKSFGYLNLADKKELLNDSSLFDLASCGKHITAMAIMMLQEQNKLNYQDKVQTFFPDFPYLNITVEHLLTHTSGLPDYMELFDEHWDTSKIATNQDMLDLLKLHKPKPSFKAGKMYEYSNTGYAVLASIVEKVSGLSFGEFLAKNIFQPLGMRHSRVYNDKYTANKWLSNYALGHTYIGAEKKFVLANAPQDANYYRYLDGIVGDGAIHSTTTDLAIWLNSLRNYQLVKKETFELAIKPYQTKKELSNYGFGWELANEDKYERLIHHSGSWGGNHTFILHFLDKDISIVVLSNNEYNNLEPLVGKIANLVNCSYK